MAVRIYTQFVSPEFDQLKAVLMKDYANFSKTALEISALKQAAPSNKQKGTE